MTLDDLRNAREQLRLRKQFVMILRKQQEEWVYGRAWVYADVNGFILRFGADTADVNINGDVVWGGWE